MKPLILSSSLELSNPGIAVASMDTSIKESLFSNPNMKMALGREVKEDDLLFFTFKLVHCGKNNNKDIFLLEEMEKMVEKRRGQQMPAWKTPEGEPIDYDHNFGFPAIVGDIYQSVLVKNPPTPGEQPYIRCAGVIYRGLYPDVAYKVVRGSQLGYARVSMEVKFKQGIPSHEGRVLRGLNFKGAALTRMPADEIADIEDVGDKHLSVADDVFETIAVGSTTLKVPRGFTKKATHPTI